MKRHASGVLFIAISSFLIAVTAGAQEGRFDLGVRGTIVTAGGEPANDILSFGVFGRYRLNERWLLGAAVDLAEYDFEVPTRVLGLIQPPEVIDASVSSNIVSTWIEREYGRPAAPIVWFWGAGVGLGFPTVDDASGPLAGGGTFDVTTDAGTEVIASAFGGFRWRPGRVFFLELAARVDHHFSEWKVRDRVSGRTGTTDDYTGWGGHLGLGFRF